MLKITGSKGFQITFENGWTASVQFGYGNYCDNRDKQFPNKPDITSSNAEVAAWHKNGDLCNIWEKFGLDSDHSDTVKGWLTPKEVLQFLVQVETLPE